MKLLHVQSSFDKTQGVLGEKVKGLCPTIIIQFASLAIHNYQLLDKYQYL